jgi:endonuclease G, mitochondrial
MSNTVLVFLHGLAKKPEAEKLLEAWRWALSNDNPRPDIFGQNNPSLFSGTDADTRLVYYADVFHGTNFETELESYFNLKNDSDTEFQNEAGSGNSDQFESPSDISGRPEAYFESKLLKKMLSDDEIANDNQEAFGLVPRPVREWAIKRLAQEAYYYLFNKPIVRDGQSIDFKAALRERLLKVLKEEHAAGKKIVVAAHSLGSIIIYDTLRNDPECPPIERLVTFGSPLGISEVQNELVAAGNDTVDFPPKLTGNWFNVYDSLDPICGLSPRLRKEFLKNQERVVIDVHQSNWGSWRHSITKYLSGPGIRNSMLGIIEQTSQEIIHMKSESDLHYRYLNSFIEKAGGVESVIKKLSNENTEEGMLVSKGKKSKAAPKSEERKKKIEVLEKIAGRQLESNFDSVAVEAIVDELRSPVLYVEKDSYANTDHPEWTELNELDYRKRIESVIPSVGRIELSGPTNIPYAGTGFIVGPNLLMTNRHVAQIFTSGLGTKNLSFKSGFGASTNFKREINQLQQVRNFSITKVLLIHPFWDVAILQVDGDFSHLTPLSLGLTDARELRQEDVFVIGYPAEDSRNPEDIQNRLFDSKFRVKRLQPGRLIGNAMTGSFGKTVNALAHNCSTLGGNSGSAVFSLKTGQVLGLHFGGLYKTANFAVPSFELSRDQRVVDTGVRFAGAPKIANPIEWKAWWDDVDGLATHSQEISKTDLASTAVGTTPPPTIFVDTKSNSQPSNASIQTGKQTMSFDIPLRITVQVEIAGSAPQSDRSTNTQSVEAFDSTEAFKEPFRDTNYSGRKGYVAEFLEAVDRNGNPLIVPMPSARRASVLAPTLAGEHILHYQNFSIAMHAKRRLCLFSAANVTAESRLKNPDPTQKTTRADLTGLAKNDIEKWFLDPRMDPKYQLPDVFFTKDRKAFDKGHIVRREDVAWGKTFTQLRRANGDSYHVTNCSPQVKEFNQSSQGELNWGDLENTIFAQAKSERLCVFSGPILSETDEVFVGSGEGGQVIRAKIPSRFWKVVVAVGEEGLTSFGFVLEQDLANVDWEFVTPTGFVPFLWPIEDIGIEAGIKFPSEVLVTDQFATGNTERVLSSGVKVRRL